MENIMLLTQKQLGTFYRDGFILVEDLFDPKEMTAQAPTDRAGNVEQFKIIGNKIIFKVFIKLYFFQSYMIFFN